MESCQAVCFITPAGLGREVVSGIVSAADDVAAIETSASKIAGALFDRRPVQIPMQSKAKSVRVKSLAGDEQTEVIIPAEIYGQIREGDIVQLLCRMRNGARICIEATNQTTKAQFVRPNFQIAPGMVSVLPFALLSLTALLVAWLFLGGAQQLAEAAVSGATGLLGFLLGLIVGLLDLFGPAVVLCLGLYLIVKGVLR